MKIHKVFPPFYNGISEQITELSNDTYCKDMINCVPDIVKGISRRPPLLYKTDFAKINSTFKLFHNYDKSDREESYLMFYTGSTTEPLYIIDVNGVKQTISYKVGDEAKIKAYLSNPKLKALTVQDRTWIVNTSKLVGLDMTKNLAPSPNFDKTAYYWLKSASGDSNNKYRYAVYLDNVLFQETGHESDSTATALANTINLNTLYNATAKGSVIKIVRNDGNDFTFDTWDSWGNMASIGFKGSVDKITDLPKTFPFADAYIIVKGQGSDVSKDYYVRWNGRTWEETRHPAEDRGALINMPIIMDRTSIDSNGISTFTIKLEEWSAPLVGNSENNPDPSFLNTPIVDILFYKNRFAIATTDSLIFSETAKYRNFYIKTALDIIDSDPIDVSIIGEKSSEILYVLQFDLGIYVFTSEGQYEVNSEGDFSIKTIQVDRSTNYAIKKDVKPIAINNKIFYISTANGLQKMYAYQRDENAYLTATDLSLVTPTLMKKDIKKILAVSNLGYTICVTNDNELYVFVNKESGSESVQIGWVRWKVLETDTNDFISFDVDCIESTLIVIAEDKNNRIHLFKMDLSDNYRDNKVDILKDDVECKIVSKIILPDYYPKITDIKNPNNKMLIKRLVVSGEGVFNMIMYRKDYKTTFNKKQEFGFKDLNFYVSSKVGTVEFTVIDDSKYNFTIKSVTMEGLYQPSSSERT